MRALAYIRLSLFVVIVTILSAVQAIGQPQYLINPSFDEPKEPEPPDCDRAAGWERWGSWVNRHVNEDGWEPRSGPAMIAYHHWESDSPDAGWYQDVAGLPAGSFCRFSVWAIWEPSCNASNVQLRLEPRGGGEPYRVETYTLKDVHRSWNLLTVQSKLPPDVSSVRAIIRCVHGMGGSQTGAYAAIKFDDASLTELSSP